MAISFQKDFYIPYPFNQIKNLLNIQSILLMVIFLILFFLDYSSFSSILEKDRFYTLLILLLPFLYFLSQQCIYFSILFSIRHLKILTMIQSFFTLIFSLTFLFFNPYYSIFIFFIPFILILFSIFNLIYVLKIKITRVSLYQRAFDLKKYIKNIFFNHFSFFILYFIYISCLAISFKNFYSSYYYYHENMENIEKSISKKNKNYTRKNYTFIQLKSTNNWKKSSLQSLNEVFFKWKETNLINTSIIYYEKDTKSIFHLPNFLETPTSLFNTKGSFFIVLESTDQKKISTLTSFALEKIISRVIQIRSFNFLNFKVLINSFCLVFFFFYFVFLILYFKSFQEILYIFFFSVIIYIWSLGMYFFLFPYPLFLYFVLFFFSSFSIYLFYFCLSFKKNLYIASPISFSPYLFFILFSLIFVILSSYFLQNPNQIKKYLVFQASIITFIHFFTISLSYFVLSTKTIFFQFYQKALQSYYYIFDSHFKRLLVISLILFNNIFLIVSFKKRSFFEIPIFYFFLPIFLLMLLIYSMVRFIQKKKILFHFKNIHLFFPLFKASFFLFFFLLIFNPIKSIKSFFPMNFVNSNFLSSIIFILLPFLFLVILLYKKDSILISLFFLFSELLTFLFIHKIIPLHSTLSFSYIIPYALHLNFILFSLFSTVLNIHSFKSILLSSKDISYLFGFILISFFLIFFFSITFSLILFLYL